MATLAELFKNKDNSLSELGEKFVKDNLIVNGKCITVSQIRKVLSAVNSIQNKITANEKYWNKSDVDYLRMKLAYQAGRIKDLKSMHDELDPILKQINSPEDFKRFARLIESITAYHKFYGGGN